MIEFLLLFIDGPVDGPDPLVTAGKEMRRAETALANRDIEETKKSQKEAVNALDELMKRAKNKNKNKGGGGGGGGGGSSKENGSKSSSSSSGSSGSSGNGGSGPATGGLTGGNKVGSNNLKPINGLAAKVWGELNKNGTINPNLNNILNEQPIPLYEEEINRYFERISKEKSIKK